MGDKNMFVAWTLIEETEVIPPFGDALREHLQSYKGSRRIASFSVWNFLYHLLHENKLPIGTVAFTESGKPYFVDQPLYFSLSHSKALCAAA
ncbi:MAG: hypothetical protein ACSW75_03995, partial [Lachnospiraceae bacterium]